MSWLTRKPFATTIAVGATRLRIERVDAPDIEVDLASAGWISFVYVGDDLAPVFEGWWMIGRPTGAVAIHDWCRMADQLIRRGALSVAAEEIADKSILFLRSRPCAFRGRAAIGHVAELTQDQVEYLRRRGIVQQVARLDDIPVID